MGVRGCGEAGPPHSPLVGNCSGRGRCPQAPPWARDSGGVGSRRPLFAAGSSSSRKATLLRCTTPLGGSGNSMLLSWTKPTLGPTMRPRASTGQTTPGETRGRGLVLDGSPGDSCHIPEFHLEMVSLERSWGWRPLGSWLGAGPAQAWHLSLETRARCRDLDKGTRIHCATSECPWEGWGASPKRGADPIFSQLLPHHPGGLLAQGPRRDRWGLVAGASLGAGTGAGGQRSLRQPCAPGRQVFGAGVGPLPPNLPPCPLLLQRGTAGFQVWLCLCREWGSLRWGSRGVRREEQGSPRGS